MHACGRGLRASKLFLRFGEPCLLARFALDFDLTFELREARPLRNGLRFLCQVILRVAALEIPQFLANLRGPLLEVGERGVIPRSNHCLAGGSRLTQGTQFAFGNGDPLLRRTEGGAEVAHLRQNLILVPFQRDDVVS